MVLAFSVVPDSNVNSENYGLRNNRATSFSARGKDPVKKFYAGDSTFLELESITPVTYRTEGHCYAVDFLVNMANETSGYHGIIDILLKSLRFRLQSLIPSLSPFLWQNSRPREAAVWLAAVIIKEGR